MRTPYPLIAPEFSGLLPVGDGHAIHVETAGNPAGIPVVFLHGGPGSGCKPSHRQFFDPGRYFSMLVDQRGAGLSRPYGGVEGNTTQALVADLEHVRRHFGIERWMLFGGSWGSTLALAYANAHRERVLALVLRGIFLARASDLEWFFVSGANRLLPAAWARFVAAVGPERLCIDALHAAVFGADESLAVRVARAWGEWSGEVVSYAIDVPEPEPGPPVEETLAKTRIEMHYAKHAYFLRENELLERAPALAGIPVHLVHGQRDLTCTPDAAFALHRALPGSTLEILRTAGHLSGEPAMTDALLRAADAMAARLAV
ncbi:MAG: prolyl aminopeptidase [Gammaproteobacteria bacterium]|nr:prolyl aminopeptidase [Gammaproteobacteria bacterium]